MGVAPHDASVPEPAEHGTVAGTLGCESLAGR
jgi:hypothetical protein